MFSLILLKHKPPIPTADFAIYQRVKKINREQGEMLMIDERGCWHDKDTLGPEYFVGIRLTRFLWRRHTRI